MRWGVASLFYQPVFQMVVADDEVEQFDDQMLQCLGIQAGNGLVDLPEQLEDAFALVIQLLNADAKVAGPASAKIHVVLFPVADESGWAR